MFNTQYARNKDVSELPTPYFQLQAPISNRPNSMTAIFLPAPWKPLF